MLLIGGGKAWRDPFFSVPSLRLFSFDEYDGRDGICNGILNHLVLRAAVEINCVLKDGRQTAIFW